MSISERSYQLAQQISKESIKSRILAVDVAGHLLTVDAITDVGEDCAETYFHAMYRDNKCEDSSLPYAIDQVLK